MHLIEEVSFGIHFNMCASNTCALNYLLTQFQMQSDEIVQQQEQPHRN